MPELPRILQAHVSLISLLVIPDLLTRPDSLKPEFSFLSSAASYAQYYRDHEGLSRDIAGPAKLQALCTSLSPLKKRHTMHSYWKSFRRSVEIARADNKNVDELFCLLPLQASIPVMPLAVNGRNYKAEAYAHLFPFGCSVINLDVNVSDMEFSEFIGFISNLKRANISCPDGLSNTFEQKNRGAFKNFAYEVSGLINTALFDGASPLENFMAHTLIFIKKAQPEFSDAAMKHRIAIAAALDGRTYEEESGLDRRVIDRSLQNQMKKFRLQELLFFTPPSSLCIASPDWNVKVPDNLGDKHDSVRAKKLDKKMSCMKNNYQSCLNVLFAVNRVLSNSIVKEKRIPPNKLDELKKSIGVAFPEDPARIYFKHVYEKVAPVIKLNENIHVLR